MVQTSTKILEYIKVRDSAGHSMRTRNLIALFGVLWSASVSSAESTARQSFFVSVPKRISITAPATIPNVEMAQDATQAALPLQVWTVDANSRSGATVRFSTSQCFHNLDDDTIRRDAYLEVSVQQQTQAGRWMVSTPTATTDHLSGQEQATVEIRSSGPGAASIALKVTLLASPDHLTPVGDYSTTVIGTITAD